MKLFFIYKITNVINGKIYIGRTNNLKRRWYQHRSAARNNPICVIDKAIAKYGEENFTYEKIDECQSKEETKIQETWNIFIHRSLVDENGYNVEAESDNPNPSIWTPERRKAAADRARGNQNRLGQPMSDYVKEKISRKGIEMSEEHKQKISNATKGISRGHKGKTWTLVDGKRVWS